MTCQVVGSTPTHGELWSIQLFVNLRRVDGFIQVFRLPSPIKTDSHDLAGILLKWTLNKNKKTHLYNLLYVVKCAIYELYNSVIWSVFYVCFFSFII